MNSTETKQKNTEATDTVNVTETQMTAPVKQRRGRKTKNPGNFAVPESFYVAPMDDAHPKAKLYHGLVAEMSKRNVRFSYTNNRGDTIDTIGTLRVSEVPTTRKVLGRLAPRKETNTVFYDVRHGIYRQFDSETVVSIIR